MVMMGSVDLPLAAIREQIAAAIDIVVHQGRYRDGSRKITEIAWIEGMQDGRVKLVPLFSFQQRGSDLAGKVRGEFVKASDPLTLKNEFRERGVF